MENDKIHDYTDAYLESYLRALDKTHNPDLAIQTAMGVTMVLRMIDAQRTEAASAAADQSNGGAFWSHDATGSAEPARGRQRDRERRR